MDARRRVPLWLRIGYTSFVAVLVPVYWVHWGPGNFLWFSDIALVAMVVALWAESPLIASMTAVATTLPEIAWNTDFFGRLLTGHHVVGLSSYMFDPQRPTYLRALSLFHVVLPVIILWMVIRFGYDRRAWIAQSGVAVVLLPMTYWLTDPAENVNWVHGPGSSPQTWMSPVLYLVLLMAAFPLVIYLPTHLLLSWLCGGRVPSSARLPDTQRLGRRWRKAPWESRG